MKHNKKTILLILITITTLILLSTASATQDTNTTSTTTSSIKEKTTTVEPVVKEKIEKTQTKQKTDKTQDKTITKTKKTRKNTKSDSINVEINNMDEIPWENYDEINVYFNEGNYNKTNGKSFTFPGKLLTFEGNGQTLNSTITMTTDKNIPNQIVTIKNMNIYGTTVALRSSTSLIFINSTINIEKISMLNNSTLIIDSLTKFNYNTMDDRGGTVFTSNQTLLEELELLNVNVNYISDSDILKPSGNEINVNNLNELTQAVNSATNDSENDYIINLNEGTYTGTIENWNKGTSTNKITINGKCDKQFSFPL